MWLPHTDLIDEYTGLPVVPEAKADAYPIVIKTPSKTAVKFLPLMKSGLKVMSVVNSAATAASMLGLPVSGVPESWQKKVHKRSAVAIGILVITSRSMLADVFRIPHSALFPRHTRLLER